MPSTSKVLAGCQVFNSRTAPDGWACVPLGDRIDLAYGSGLREEDREQGGIAVYGSNGVIGSHTRALVDGPGILVGRKGTVGAVHYASGPFWPIDTVYYVVPRHRDNLRFLHHLLNYLPLRSLNAATGVPGLSRRDAYSLLGLFPPREEQAAIARILDAVDTVLERTRGRVDALRNLKKSTMHDLLTGKVRVGDRSDVISTDSTLPNFPKVGNHFYYTGQQPKKKERLEGIIRESRILAGCQVFNSRTAPDGWACVPLGDRIDLAYGSGLREEDREQGGIAVYGSNGVIGSHTRALVDGPGILVGRKGTVGAVHYASGPFWPIDTVYYVVPRHRDNLRFLHHLLNYLPLRSLNAATGVPGLSRRDAYSLLGLFPPREEQAAIARILDAVDTVLERTRGRVDALRNLKKSTMHDLLTGKVRVGDMTKALAP